jgi:hypothetical protein
MRLEKIIGLAILSFVLCTLAFADNTQKRDRIAATPPPDFSGYYAIDGEDGLKGGDTVQYTGLLCIRKVEGQLYHCAFQNGLSSSIGLGQLKNDVFAIGWTSGEPVKARGCSIYVRKGNDLVGTWASLPGSGVARPERLKWLAKLKPDEETPEPPIDKCSCGEPVCPCGRGCGCGKGCCCDCKK